MRGSSVMTRAEVEEYCRATGQPTPQLDAGKPAQGRARASVDFGGRYGRAVLTVEFDESARGSWLQWLAERAEQMGGRVHA